MTVCVFDTATNTVWADSVGMAGGYYTGNVSKVTQIRSPHYVHTIMAAGTSWLCSAVTARLAEALRKSNVANMDYLGLQQVIAMYVKNVSPLEGEQDAFDAIVIEFEVETERTRIYKFNNAMFPFEFSPKDGELLCIGQQELCMAVALAHEINMENADLVEFKDVDIGDIIKRLSKYHAAVSPNLKVSTYNTRGDRIGYSYVP